jgi:hypothetical protein
VLHSALLLLGCIKLMLFFLAFVISQSAYFAAFFGTESCFFSRTGASKLQLLAVVGCMLSWVMSAC